MQFDRRILEEYPFDGLFYTIETDTEGGLLAQESKEVEVLRVKCDIQQTSQWGTYGLLASTYTIYFPLKSKVLSSNADIEQDEIANEGANPSEVELVNDDTFEDVLVKRGMLFRGMIYGYEVNGKVVGVAPSMLGGVACQIKDLDE